MNANNATRIAAALGFLAVALGAFGAHGLQSTLEANGTTTIWEKAVFYHLLHAVMLFLLAQRPVLSRGSWVIFSGSLYVLAVTNLKWLGAITPLGGISFLVGWGWLIWTGHRGPESGGCVNPMK